MTIGEKVKEIRMQKKLTFREIAKRTGLDFGGLCRLEQDKSSNTSVKNIDPRIGTLKMFCEGLNYDFALFLAETGYLNPNRVCMNDDEVENLKQFRQKISTENMENILEMEQILSLTDKNEESILKK